jgi:hypothetical protein
MSADRFTLDTNVRCIAEGFYLGEYGYVLVRDKTGQKVLVRFISCVGQGWMPETAFEPVETIPNNV